VQFSSDVRLTQLTTWLEEHFNLTDLQLSVVSGDASFRRYFRFTHGDRSLIGVDAPPDKEDSQPFVDVSAAYAEQGLLVPKVIHADMALGFMCLSDLGDDLLLPALNQQTVDDYYQKSLALLPGVAKAISTINGPLPLFDEALLRNEMILFTDWLLPCHLDVKLDDTQQKVIDKTFDLLIKNALEQPQVGVHRDFHSRNLMIVKDNQIATIDYQDAVIGGVTYDAVSLLRDCYITWPDELVYRHLLEFKQLMSESIKTLKTVDDETFIRWFDLMGLQRHIKVCGIFARLYYRDEKDGYLDDIPRVLDYVIDVGRKYPEFAAFIDLLEGLIKPLLLSKAS
jgi:aminoglycoside/choline kinase family phosphotransferase